MRQPFAQRRRWRRDAYLATTLPNRLSWQGTIAGTTDFCAGHRRFCGHRSRVRARTRNTQPPARVDRATREPSRSARGRTARQTCHRYPLHPLRPRRSDRACVALRGNRASRYRDRHAGQQRRVRCRRLIPVAPVADTRTVHPGHDDGTDGTLSSSPARHARTRPRPHHQRGLVAGLLLAPAGHTLYAASKAYLIKFSQALAVENRRHAINVCALCPGLTYLEFHDVNDTRPHMQRLSKRMWMSADAVARDSLAAVERATSCASAVASIGPLNACSMPCPTVSRWVSSTIAASISG